jgi:hypothetical protein
MPWTPKMTAGGWPLAGKAHIGDDDSLVYSGFLAGVPPAGNVIRAEGCAEPGTGSFAYGRLPRHKAVTHALTPTGR